VKRAVHSTTTTPRRRSAQVLVRLLPEDMKRAKAEAHKNDETVAAWARRTLLAALRTT